MKNIFIWALCILCISCSQKDNNLFDDLTERGGFIQFVENPELRFDLETVPDFTLSADITDPNNNATNYALTLLYEDVEIENFVSISSFPNTLTITGQEIFDVLNITADSLSLASQISFLATVTTPNGVFSTLAPDFNATTNTQEGGNTSLVLLRPGEKGAMSFSITFFLPAPPKLRGTSFEEPFAAPTDGSDYTRPEEDADKEGELLNNPGERHVMHVATGTGVDDEIGFKSEFFSSGNGGFTNEEIGVTRKTDEIGGAYIDGLQGFQLEDVEGLFRLTFDRVEVVPANNPVTGVQIFVYFADTSWESADTIRIYAMVERGGTMETLELLNLAGDDIEDVAGSWNLIDSGLLDGVTAYTLIIDAEMDSGNEQIYFDRMSVYLPE